MFGIGSRTDVTSPGGGRQYDGVREWCSATNLKTWPSPCADPIRHHTTWSATVGWRPDVHGARSTSPTSGRWRGDRQGGLIYGLLTYGKTSKGAELCGGGFLLKHTILAISNRRSE